MNSSDTAYKVATLYCVLITFFYVYCLLMMTNLKFSFIFQCSYEADKALEDLDWVSAWYERNCNS